MQTSPSNPAGIFKPKLKSAIFVGIIWFVCSFLVTELCQRLSYQLFLYSDKASVTLMNVADMASFPSYYVYDTLLKSRAQKAFDQYYAEHPDDIPADPGTSLADLSSHEFWDILDLLENKGYDVHISRKEQYAITLGSCAFTGFLLALVVLVITGNYRSRPADRD